MASSLLTELYNPKAFFAHAALLRQAFAHCARFPTAASRRSLGRISVPVWLIVLSDQLSIAALVSRYLTNKLMLRGPIPERKPKLPFGASHLAGHTSSGISSPFELLSRSPGQVAHVLLTRSPLEYPRRGLSARLACVKHAASVRPEPGSNSPRKLDARGRSPGTSLGRARSSNDEACASFVCDPTTGRESRSFSNDGSQDGVIWACRTRRCAGALAFVDRLRTDDRLLALFSFQRSRARRHKMPPPRCGRCSPSGPVVRANPFGGELPPDGHSREVVSARTTASPTGTSHYS